MSKMSDNLNKLMEERNIKQADLCRETGIPTSAMSHYVRGDSDPSFTRAIKIARALGVTTDELSGKQAEQQCNGIKLSDDEREIINVYRNISDEGKDAVMTLLRGIEKRFGWSSND